MEVKNIIDPFSKEWDTLLNTILDTYITYEVQSHVIDFTVTVSEDKPWWYFGFTRTITSTFKVWIENKGGAYGTLYKRDGARTPKYAASQETLDRLYAFETNKSCIFYKL